MLAGPEWSVTLPASAPDAESEAALRSLGYAGAHPLPDAPGDSLPDAKDRVRIESYLSRAGSALEAGRAASARRALSSALGLDSRNKEAHLLLARVQAATGEVSRALETFRWCLSLPPASMNALVYYEAARVTLDAGLLDEAADFSRRACRIDPRHMEARFNWGVTAFRQDRPGEAAMHWEEVLRMDPEHPEASRWLPEARAMAAGRGDRE
ncbi:MAG: hypothetical protein CME07_01710 [Gemmatimonadetes bacterium]|nr:hypothetical protein [Gemmatimonadota bacterium]